MSENQKVTLWPWCSDIPYISIEMDNIDIFFESNTNKEFTIYENLILNIDETNSHLHPDERDDMSDFPQQPEYAFIISNKLSQIKFMENRNQLLLSVLDNTHKLTSIEITCDAKYGMTFKDLMKSEFSPYKTSIMDVNQTIVNPYQSWVYYDCTATTYKFNDAC